MENKIKVYHYCYYAENKKYSGYLENQRIYKRCYLGELQEDDTITIPGWSDEIFLPLDCENVHKILIDIDENTIMIDYFTIDEINGYENFINYTLGVLKNNLFKVINEVE